MSRYDEFEIDSEIDDSRDFFGEVIEQGLLDDEGPRFMSAESNPVKGAARGGLLDAPAFMSDGWDDETPPVEPTLLGVDGTVGLLYPGESHLLFGMGGSGKSFLAQHAVAEIAKAGGCAVYVDYESNLRTVRARLKAMGVSKSEAGRIAYWRIVKPLQGQTMGTLLDFVEAYSPSLFVLDGVSKAMVSGGFKENENSDVHAWDGRVVVPLVRAGVTVLLIDHVAKPTQNAAGGSELYARGAGAKIDAVSGAAYRFDAVVEWTRTSNGSAKMTVAKDREGHRRKGAVAAFVDVTVEDDGEALTFVLRSPDADEAGAKKTWSGPTFLMTKISEFVESAARPVSKREIGDAVTGRRSFIAEAVETLVAAGNLRVVAGRSGHPAYEFVSAFGVDVANDGDPF